MKKFISLILVLLAVFSMAVSASALDVDSGMSGSATITVSNAARGETYAIYKLFDATVTGEEDGSMSYTGEIPGALVEYFDKDAAGNIYAKDAAKDETDNTKLSAVAVNAITNWAKTATHTAFAVAGGSELNFTGLTYGMYVISTTQGSVITVDSTNPNATIVDKNTTEPSATKSVDDSNVSIGDTVTYTATFPTANWLVDENGVNHKVVKYVIDDTLPEFLSNVTVTGLIIDEDGDFTTTTGQIVIASPVFTEKEISLDWVDENGNQKYNNGAVIQLTYTAKVTAEMAVDGTAGNVNTVTLTPYVDNSIDPDFEPDPWSKTYFDSASIFTYAALLKKVDEDADPLAGAKFAANGLTVTGSNGNYTVVSYDSTSTAQGTVMETDDEGKLYISGLASDVILTLTETEAPAGYNKLVGTTTMSPAVIGAVVTGTTTTVYYDADGSVSETATETSKTVVNYNVNFDTEGNFIQVVNQKGLELPSTGGIGTTVFYVLGGVLMLGAVVVLATRRRMDKDQ